MNADGSAVRALTHAKKTARKNEFFSGPAWSPDGERLALIFGDPEVDIHTAGNIEIMRPDGSRARDLMTGNEPIVNVTWSPDSRRIAYLGCCDPARLYVVGVASGRSRRIDRGQVKDSFDFEQPSWSPKSDEVALSKADVHPDGSEGPSRLFTIAVDGSGGLRRLTATEAFNPDWSPDGTRIAFDNGRDIFVIRSGGGDRSRLTRARAGSTRPSLVAGCHQDSLRSGQKPESEAKPDRPLGDECQRQQPAPTRAECRGTGLAIDYDEGLTPTAQVSLGLDQAETTDVMRKLGQAAGPLGG